MTCTSLHVYTCDASSLTPRRAAPRSPWERADDDYAWEDPAAVDEEADGDVYDEDVQQSSDQGHGAWHGPLQQHFAGLPASLLLKPQ